MVNAVVGGPDIGAALVAHPGVRKVAFTGLAAGIWTSDTSRALRLAEQIDAGTVWINTYGMFDVAVPFGGRKHSGFGRELGEEALEPYLTSKSVWVDLQSAAQAGQAGQAITR